MRFICLPLYYSGFVKWLRARDFDRSRSCNIGGGFRCLLAGLGRVGAGGCLNKRFGPRLMLGADLAGLKLVRKVGLRFHGRRLLSKQRALDPFRR